MKAKAYHLSLRLLATSLLLSGAALAAPVPFTNAGFESPVVADGAFTASATGWSNVNSADEIGVINPGVADFTAQAPEGANVGYVYGGVVDAGLSRILTATLQADASYSLGVKVGNSLTYAYDGYRVQLLAGGTVLAEDNNTLSPAADTFVTSTVNYTYNAGLHAGLVGQPLEIRLLGKGQSGDTQGETEFDDVQLAVTLGNPAANPGGPYTVPFNGPLNLDGSTSLPSEGQSLTAYEWDLDNDGDFDEAITGATPASIPFATLIAASPAGYGMEIGANTIKLRVTDSSAKTSTVEGTVNLSGPLVIYEPFADLETTLAGNTPGLGLSGTWSSGAIIANRSLTYGKLAYQGGRVVTNPANSVQTGWVSPGTTLTGAGLMADGATLWFSVLIKKYPDTSATTNDRTTYFSLGTGGIAPDGFDRIGGNTGNGFAFVVNQDNAGKDRLQGWNNNSATTGGAFRSPLVSWGPEGTTILAVGKITWGAFNATPALAVNDVFELYLPDKDLNLGSVVSTLNGNFNQLGTGDATKAFNTIGFAGKRGATGENNTPEIDEFRFGATSADVLPLDFANPVLVSTDNASGSGIARVATFDEEVYVGTGDIRIVNETTPGTTTITLPDPQVVFSGNTLTITPSVPLSGGATYHIEVDAGAARDRNLNGFAGLSSPDLWEFTVDGTPPTVVSFGDNTFPKPILTNSSILTYTVTFSEAINAATVTTADFAASAGSAPITVNSVTATGNPAVFNVAVTTGGTTGTLKLEIVAGAVIKDVNGLDLVTTTAIPSDNTITVNNPTPNAGSITNDFQGTIASQSNAKASSEARFFNVSVNPANAGTGWYCADLPNSGTDGPAGVRNYTGPVVAYKFLGGTNNSVSGVTGSGGDSGRITYATNDLTFDGFGQQQLRLWTTNDPGADLATVAGSAATGFDSIGNFGYRDWSGATGTIDIASMASGSVHIYYGSYNSAPTLKVTMRDTDNVGADIVIANAHSVAGGGNGDSANTAEYYLAEIDFVSDGIYDVVIYEWTSSNGRGLGTVLTGPAVAASPYAAWATTNAPTTGNDPSADEDGDGVSNGVEFVIGGSITTNDLDKLPTVATTPGGDMTFTFKRDQDSIDPKTAVTIEVGTDLATWNTPPSPYTVPDVAAVNNPGVTVEKDTPAVGTDKITLTVPQTPDTKKFARIKVVITP